MKKNERNYKVYIHTCNANGKKYVGITKLNLIDRWGSEGQGYNKQFFYRAIKKYGWDNFTHEVVYDGLSRKEAEQKEIELIAKYRTNDKRYGYNVENGGYSNIVTEETKKKIQKKQRENPHTHTPVYKYSLDGKFICEYISVSAAARENGVSFGAIFSCLRGDTRKAGGFQWKVADGNKNDIGRYLKRLRTNENLMKRVIKYDLNGIKLAEYKCLREAREHHNNSSHISACCNGKRKSACGYIWRYAS